MPTSTRAIRIAGGVLTACGLFLSGAMTWLISWLGNTISHPSSTHRWTAGPEFTDATFQLFYSVLLFGGVALVAGLFQLKTGRRGRGIVGAMLLAFGWLAYALWTILSLDKTL